MKKDKALTRIRGMIVFFMIALALSGITAFPIHSEVQLLDGYVHLMPTALHPFLTQVIAGVNFNDIHFPFMAYGTDWLAFAHIVIAIGFIGPYRDPVRNIWVIESGMISCLLIIPLAFICGAIRGIPFLWQLIDCSFAIIGFLPLLYVHKQIRKYEQQGFKQNNTIKLTGDAQ